MDRQLRDTHQEVRQLRREIREAHNLIQTLFHTRDLHHRRLISIEQRLGLRLIPRLPCNVSHPNSLIHEQAPIPSTSSVHDIPVLLSDRIRSPVSPSVAASILLPASSSSDTLYSQNDSTSSSSSERILPIFAPTPLLVRINLTEGDEANPITIE